MSGYVAAGAHMATSKDSDVIYSKSLSVFHTTLNLVFVTIFPFAFVGKSLVKLVGANHCLSTTNVRVEIWTCADLRACGHLALHLALHSRPTTPKIRRLKAPRLTRVVPPVRIVIRL